MAFVLCSAKHKGPFPASRLIFDSKIFSHIIFLSVRRISFSLLTIPHLLCSCELHFRNLELQAEHRHWLHSLAADTLPSLLMCAKAPSTTSKYSACWKKWLLWDDSKSDVPPVQPYYMCLYISHNLSTSSGVNSSADSLVAWVKWAHSLAGISLPSPYFIPTTRRADDPMVKTAVQGYNHLHASPVRRKEPVTPNIMFKLFAYHGNANASLADLRILFIVVFLRTQVLFVMKT